jgi:hypothetical protein
MPPTLTILSTDGTRRAIVSATDDGAAVAFYRRVIVDDARGIAPGAEQRPQRWRFLRASFIPQPLHVALDIALGVVEAGL